MDILAWFKKPTPPAPPPIVGRDDTEKVAFHIERFERALSQCTNDAKRADLAKNLAYWQAIKSAQEGLN